MVDALVWESAAESIFEVFSDVRHLNQLLLRAELRRILELDGLQRPHGRNYLDEINAHIPIVEWISSRAAAEPV
jgi:hypothetical protein